MVKKYTSIYIILCFFLSVIVFSLEKDSISNKDKEKFSFPGYRKVRLKMNWEKVLEILKKDNLLKIDLNSQYGELDEFFPVIKVKAKPFIRLIYYQFTNLNNPMNILNIQVQDLKKWLLYAITIHFDTRYEDYISLYRLMYEKYGQAEIHQRNYIKWVFDMKNDKLKEPDIKSNINKDNKEKENVSNKSNEGKEENKKFSIVLTRPAIVQIIDDNVLNVKRNENQIRRFNILKTYENKIYKNLLKDFLSEK